MEKNFLSKLLNKRGFFFVIFILSTLFLTTSLLLEPLKIMKKTVQSITNTVENNLPDLEIKDGKAIYSNENTVVSDGTYVVFTNDVFDYQFEENTNVIVFDQNSITYYQNANNKVELRNFGNSTVNKEQFEEIYLSSIVNLQNSILVIIFILFYIVISLLTLPIILFISIWMALSENINNNSDGSKIPYKLFYKKSIKKLLVEMFFLMLAIVITAILKTINIPIWVCIILFLIMVVYSGRIIKKYFKIDL